MFKLNARMLSRGGGLARANREGIRRSLLSGMRRVTLLAERLLRQDYLRRGGAFRRAKGRPWEPNRGQWLRVGDGTLSRSWRAVAPRVVPGGVQGRIATNVPYARIHEYGGQAGRGRRTRIPKRPYLAPMLRDHRDEFRSLLGREVTSYLKGNQ